MESHLPPLIADLALILIVSAIVTLIFRKIKQPLVLGYIIAGFLVGPHFSFTPSVVDMNNVKTWADIGVIFLLFSLGLEFSFKKLMRVGGSASITAFVEIAFITIAGFFTGKLLGWNTMDCLFLGGMLASSSTTIIIRAFEELGMKSKNFARVVFGVLVVEDIVVILLMVLLSTVAVTQHFEGAEMLFTVAKLMFFLALWFILGIFLLPTALKRMKPLLDEEAYLLLSIGLCLGMVLLATSVGFSAELGAFIMGSIFAETTSAEKIEHIFHPVKSLFAAVFFVSVGMMIDPVIISEYFWIVLIVTFLTIFGKLFSTTLGAILSGQTLKQSVQVGMSMAQIGEFAFIVATLGMSLGVISDFLFPVAVGASALTTFTTPYMIKYSEKFEELLEKILPNKLIAAIDRYSTGTQTIQAQSEWKNLAKQFAVIILTNGIISVAIIILGVRFLHPFLQYIINNELIASTATFALTLLIASPFLWALMRRVPEGAAYVKLTKQGAYSRGPLLIRAIIRVVLGLALVWYLASNLFALSFVMLAIIILAFIVIFLFTRKFQKLYDRIENRFLKNLHGREIDEEQKSTMANVKKRFYQNLTLSTWDAHLAELEVSQDAEYAGRTLKSLSWRDNYGITVVYIKRGEKLLYAPGPNSKILPFDYVGIIASDEQIQEFKPVFEAKISFENENYNADDIILQKFTIDAKSRLKGITVKNSAIRETSGGMIIGIERNNDRIIKITPDIVFKNHDIVWIVGDKNRLKDFEI